LRIANFEEIGGVFDYNFTTSDDMVKWLIPLDLAWRIGLSTLWNGVLIVI